MLRGGCGRGGRLNDVVRWPRPSRTAERRCTGVGPSRTAERSRKAVGAWQFGRRPASPAAICGRAGRRVVFPLPPSAFPGRYLRPCGGAGVVLRVPLPPSASPAAICGRAGAPVRCCNQEKQSDTNAGAESTPKRAATPSSTAPKPAAKAGDFFVQVLGRTFHQAMSGILKQSQRDKV
jgi:hypothetical protein